MQENETRCPFCSELVLVSAKKCKHCGEWLDGRSSKKVGEGKNKYVAWILAWFLGGLGVHKFYLNQAGQGIIYLLLCWTLIPSIIAFFEGLVYVMMSQSAFEEKYQ